MQLVRGTGRLSSIRGPAALGAAEGLRTSMAESHKLAKNIGAIVMRIAFIGIGRLGQTLARALAQQGQNIVAVAGRATAPAVALAQQIPHCQAMMPQQALDAADLVFLSVPDDAIEALTSSLNWRANQAVVHCSGATDLQVLQSARAAGAQVGGFHPLQIFSDPERAAVLLRGSSVAIDAEQPLRNTLLALANGLQMNPLILPAGSRAAYHAGASFAASLMLSLLDEAVQVWSAIGLPEDAALPALMPLAMGTLQAAQSRGLSGALAGPVSRGDVGVVAKHLQALDALGGAHGDFYRELTRRQLSLAQRSGRLNPEALARLQRLLDGQISE